MAMAADTWSSIRSLGCLDPLIMEKTSDWAFPDSLQPDPAHCRFDLAAALDSVVMLRSEVPEDAFTAGILGTERVGNGVVIRENGLVLTIGYLITEAETIWITTNSGAAVEGHPLAYDMATGFGLVQPLGRRLQQSVKPVENRAVAEKTLRQQT